MHLPIQQGLPSLSEFRSVRAARQLSHSDTSLMHTPTALPGSWWDANEHRAAGKQGAEVQTQLLFMDQTPATN